MKRRTIYDLTGEDRTALIRWLNRDISYRELGGILGMSHENARTHIAALLRQMYEEGLLSLNNPTPTPSPKK